MDLLERQIRRAQRRLFVVRLFRRLSICWSVALLVALLAIAVRKLWNLEIDGLVWAEVWIGGSLAGGLIAAVGWTVWQRDTPIEAALEIDRRFGLKERISSSLALSPVELETEAGQALLADAARRADRIDVAGAFRVRPDRWSLLPLVPGVAAFALALLVGDKGAESIVKANTQPALTNQVKTSNQQLHKKLEEKSKEAREKGLDEMADLLKKVEIGSKELADKDDVDRKKTLVKLNDLAKELENRRDKRAGEDQLKQQFKQLKDLQPGPADKIAGELQKGNFEQAAKQLEQLKQQLAKNELNEKQKEELAKQLDQLQQHLEKQAQAREQAKQDLERQLEQARQAGQNQQAEKIQQQLDKLAQQCAKCQKGGDMAKQLGEAAAKLRQGDGKGAQAALDKLAANVGEMQQAAEEMAMLDQALDDIADAKNSSNCKNCQGQGCAMCQGNKPGEKPGNGLGRGRGFGPRPEHENPTGFYDSNVRQNVGKGSAVVTDMITGPNRKGEVQEEIKSSFETSKHEAADPLTGQRLPREYREHAKTYFDAIREGQK